MRWFKDAADRSALLARRGGVRAPSPWVQVVPASALTRKQSGSDAKSLGGEQLPLPVWGYSLGTLLPHCAQPHDRRT